MLASDLEVQSYAEADGNMSYEAARIYHEFRRVGKTVRTAIDCCIGEISLANEALLLHRDHDFRTIARVRPLRERWIGFSRAADSTLRIQQAARRDLRPS